jgi:glycosyltransferase involved in cell wall biosynthesis
MVRDVRVQGSAMKIAVLWSRFGPYHLARLRGAADAAVSCGATVTGIEVAATDQDYAWAQAHGAHDFERVTLFPRGDYHALSAGEIADAVTQALDRLRPAAVAINGWSVPEARAAVAWCRRQGRRAVLMSETKADDHHRPWWKELVKRQLLRRFDAALVGGRAQGDYLVSLGFPRERIHFGYDVVDNWYFKAEAREARAEAERLPRELRLPERYFLACTRFLARKNVDGLLQAYKLYRQQSDGQAWGLVILGSGEEGESLLALAGELGLHDVQWPGFVQYDELPTYYGLAGAFIHPAKAEPWGLVLNEAAASGLPILCSRTVGARYELVRDGENGMLFDPNDSDDITSAMIRVAEMEPERRAAMGRRSEAIVADWTPARFGRQLMAAAGLVSAKGSRQAAAC